MDTEIDLMNNDELKTKLTELFPSVGFEEGTEWLTLVIEPGAWRECAEALRTLTDLQFDFLFCVTCVDWKSHLTMVYHFTSTRHRHTVVVKSKLDRMVGAFHYRVGIIEKRSAACSTCSHGDHIFRISHLVV